MQLADPVGTPRSILPKEVKLLRQDLTLASLSSKHAVYTLRSCLQAYFDRRPLLTCRAGWGTNNVEYQQSCKPQAGAEFAFHAERSCSCSLGDIPNTSRACRLEQTVRVCMMTALRFVWMYIAKARHIFKRGMTAETIRSLVLSLVSTLDFEGHQPNSFCSEAPGNQPPVN